MGLDGALAATRAITAEVRARRFESALHLFLPHNRREPVASQEVNMRNFAQVQRVPHTSKHRFLLRATLGLGECE